METVNVVFTKRKFNPTSWIIRWCLPRSRFHSSQSSHAMIVDGDYVIEATMLHGTRRVLKAEALKGAVVVADVHYSVPDAEAGLAWARAQVGLPYDFKGAVGLALSPDRDWTEQDSWFCYELAAATLKAAGRDVFKHYGHISENQLLAIKP
jgi:uncharacterized protein YycO